MLFTYFDLLTHPPPSTTTGYCDSLGPDLEPAMVEYTDSKFDSLYKTGSQEFLANTLEVGITEGFFSVQVAAVHLSTQIISIILIVNQRPKESYI